LPCVSLDGNAHGHLDGQAPSFVSAYGAGKHRIDAMEFLLIIEALGADARTVSEIYRWAIISPSLVMPGSQAKVPNRISKA
jgi:hypothetical protein